jgi:hypothetical protein
MPFFLLFPLWLLCVACGVALLFVKRLKHVGIYTVAVSTAAVLCAFVLSTAVLYIAPRMVKTPVPTWYGLSLMAAYILSIGLGGVVGGVAGFLTTHKLLRPR